MGRMLQSHPVSSASQISPRDNYWLNINRSPAAADMLSRWGNHTLTKKVQWTISVQKTVDKNMIHLHGHGSVLLTTHAYRSRTFLAAGNIL